MMLFWVGFCGLQICAFASFVMIVVIAQKTNYKDDSQIALVGDNRVQ
jgi:hypothetical protein